jgi:hypothetical protein
VTQVTQRQAGRCLAVALTLLALTVLALGNRAVPASARTFDFNAAGTMVQQPLPHGFACALLRAMLDRRIPCQGLGDPGGRAATGLVSRNKQAQVTLHPRT